MAAIANYYGTRVLQALINGEALTVPAGVYVALYNTNPTAADTGTEVSGSGYARVSASGSFGAAAVTGGKATVSNTSKITFAEATADWTTANYWALRTALTGGNLICYAPLNVSKDVKNGDIPSFEIGGLTVTLE